MNEDNQFVPIYGEVVKVKGREHMVYVVEYGLENSRITRVNMRTGKAGLSYTHGSIPLIDKRLMDMERNSLVKCIKIIEARSHKKAA